MDQKEQCVFSSDLTEEERTLLEYKVKYLTEYRDLPDEVRKPLEPVYEDGVCTGYSYEVEKEPLITLHELFQKEKMEEYHIDGYFLAALAKKVLDLLRKFSELGIYPGLIDLKSICVEKNHPERGLKIIHPEHFQLGGAASTYPWYPSDSRLFDEDLKLFTEETQKKADAKLIYKILTASSRGNAKIPPDPVKQELSYIFFNILSREWKEIFMDLADKNVEYSEMEQLLLKSIEEEKQYEVPENRAVTVEVKRDHKKVPGAESYALIVILREAGKSAHDISRQLYLLQEELERDELHHYSQGFVLGDRHIFTREFRTYPYEFRSQLAHVIRGYSYGEALIAAADMMEQAQKRESRPSVLYILLDGEILNDAMYQKGLEAVMELKERRGTRISIRSARKHRGEGYRNLLKAGEEEGK